MKNLIKFILFLIYTVCIFFVKEYITIGLIAIFNISLMIALKINIKNEINKLVKLLPFILFTVVINILFADLEFAILIGIRLILVCNLSYIFSKTISYTEFGEIIGLVITIALSFVPLMKNEFAQLKNVLGVKGIEPTNFNLLKNLSLIFKPFFISILQRLNEIEMSLKAKGYQ